MIEPELVFTTGDDKYPNAVEAVLEEREKNKRKILENPQKYIERITNLEQRVMKNSNVSNARIQLEKIRILKEEFEREIEEKDKSKD